MRDVEDRMLPVGEMKQAVRKFESGATRNLDDSKYDYEGFLSPLVIERYGKYMHSHRMQADGTLRDGDNWQKGIELNSYMKSGWRHFIDWWKHHRNLPVAESLEEALCALIFNTSGYLHEVLKRKLALEQYKTDKEVACAKGMMNTKERIIGEDRTNHSYGYGGSCPNTYGLGPEFGRGKHGDTLVERWVPDGKTDVCKTP